MLQVLAAWRRETYNGCISIWEVMVRIGLISDTHIPEAAAEIPPQVFKALQGSDLIVHCGDMHSVKVLDWLEEGLGPVVGAWGNGDKGSAGRMHQPDDPRMKDVQVLELEGFKIGVIHDFPFPDEAPTLDMNRLMLHFFEERMDIILCGHTHVARIGDLNGTLMVNPGSPTLPRNLYDLGQVAILDIENGVPKPRIIELKDV